MGTTVTAGTSWPEDVQAAVRQIEDLPRETVQDMIDALKAYGNALEGLDEHVALFNHRASNPVSAFNSLYLKITEGVRDGLAAGTFRDPAYMARLDIEFATLYIEALQSWVTTGTAPPEWGTLFKLHASGQVHTRLEGAVLGVNAHINHDLSIALVRTINALGDGNDEARRADFLTINNIFQDKIGEIWNALINDLRNKFDRAIWNAVNRVLGNLDERIMLWAITWCRQLAWEEFEGQMRISGPKTVVGTAEDREPKPQRSTVPIRRWVARKTAWLAVRLNAPALFLGQLSRSFGRFVQSLVPGIQRPNG